MRKRPIVEERSVYLMSEQGSGYFRWSSDELMTGAEQGFDLAHAYVHPDADIVRAEAASAFELAAGRKILAELEAKGVTLEQIEQLAPHEMRELVESLAPDAMREISDRIASLDGRARRLLEDTAYHTLRNNGLTKND